MLSQDVNKTEVPKDNPEKGHRRTLSAPAELQAASIASVNLQKYEDEKYIEQIYQKQARDYAAHLTWIYEYKFKVSLSDTWNQKVVDFYTQALKLNKITENNPLDEVTAVHYFVRLLNVHQSELNLKPDSQREGLLYEVMVMSINLSNKMNIDAAPWTGDYVECLDENYYHAYLQTLSEKEKAAFEASAVRTHFKHAVNDLQNKFNLDGFSTAVMLLVLSHKNQKSYLDPLIDTIQKIQGSTVSYYEDSSLKKNLKKLRKEAIKILPQREQDLLSTALPEEKFKLALMAAHMASKLEAKRPTVDKKYPYVRKQEKNLRKALEHLKSMPRMMSVELTFEKKAKARLVQVERQALASLKFQLAILSEHDLLKDLYKKLNFSVKEAQLFNPQSPQYIDKLPIEDSQKKEMLTLYKQKSSQILESLTRLSGVEEDEPQTKPTEKVKVTSEKNLNSTR